MNHRRTTNPRTTRIFSCLPALAVAGAIYLFLLASCALDVAGVSAVSEPALDAGPVDASLPPEGGPTTDDGSLGADALVSETGGDAFKEAGVDAADASADAGCTDPLTCLRCSAGTMYCPGSSSCVSDCKASCATEQIGCIACSTADVPSVATCVTPAQATSCINGANLRCTCAAGVVTLCPGSHQVCVSNQCLACGETATDGLNCAAGKQCDAIDSNAADRYKCR